jgi:hypothetical protein
LIGSLRDIAIFANTVKPVNNDHPWDLKKWSLEECCLKNISGKKASGWSLLAGGHCLEVVVKTGLTVEANCQGLLFSTFFN